MRRAHLNALIVLVMILAAGWLLWQQLTMPEEMTETQSASPQATPTENPYADLFKSITPPTPISRPTARLTAENPAPAEAHNALRSPPEVPRTIKQRSNQQQGQSHFKKIAFNGEVLSDTAIHWSCARDLSTGLLWETKLMNNGVSDAAHRYSWYQPRRANRGRKNGGRCSGTACDTNAYTLEMNRLALCGSRLWRLPEFSELESLINRNYYNPTIDQEIFPHAQGKVYWSATELTNNPGMVMQIDFLNGVSTAVPKNLNYRIRVVSN